MTIICFEEFCGSYEIFSDRRETHALVFGLVGTGWECLKGNYCNVTH